MTALTWDLDVEELQYVTDEPELLPAQLTSCVIDCGSVPLRCFVLCAPSCTPTPECVPAGPPPAPPAPAP